MWPSYPVQLILSLIAYLENSLVPNTSVSEPSGPYPVSHTSLTPNSGSPPKHSSPSSAAFRACLSVDPTALPHAPTLSTVLYHPVL